MVNGCGLCPLRVSDWVMSSGKSVIGKSGLVYHKSCVMDYELVHGQAHPDLGFSLLDRKSPITEGANRWISVSCATKTSRKRLTAKLTTTTSISGSASKPTGNTAGKSNGSVNEAICTKSSSCAVRVAVSRWKALARSSFRRISRLSSKGSAATSRLLQENLTSWSFSRSLTPKSATEIPMKINLAAKTQLICFVCRHTIATLENKFIFPKVYDFCPACVKLMEYDFARQLNGLPSLPLKALKEPRRQKVEDDGA